MWWHLLGIEANAEKALVKKTYAKLIKEVDQDNDIDEFTKIHQAFRIAMKSFKQDPKDPKIDYSYDEQSDMYINNLNRVYSNTKKRLKLNLWKDALACMSFIEEKSFQDKYVDFFNEHYLLIDDIWAYLDKIYPIKEQKNFKWKDLCNGNFSISSSEITKIDMDQRCNYTEMKISIYYKIMDKNYNEALADIKEFMSLYGEQFIGIWYMTIAINMGHLEEIEKAYKILVSDKKTECDAYYQMAGYLSSIGEYKKSQELLSKINEKDSFSDRLGEENMQELLGKDRQEVNLLPWNELNHCSKKKIKLFSSGHYVKALKADTHGLMSIVHKGGR